MPCHIGLQSLSLSPIQLSLNLFVCLLLVYLNHFRSLKYVFFPTDSFFFFLFVLPSNSLNVSLPFACFHLFNFSILFVIVFFFFFFSVPGSHDSFTFWVDVHAPVGPDQKPYVKYLATMFSVLAKKVMVKWSMTQVMSSDRCHVQTQ